MTLILAALDRGSIPLSSTIYKVMTEYEEKQTRESIQSYRNMIRYMSMQIELAALDRGSIPLSSTI